MRPLRVGAIPQPKSAPMPFVPARTPIPAAPAELVAAIANANEMIVLGFIGVSVSPKQAGSALWARCNSKRQDFLPGKNNSRKGFVPASYVVIERHNDSRLTPSRRMKDDPRAMRDTAKCPDLSLRYLESHGARQGRSSMRMIFDFRFFCSSRLVVKIFSAPIKIGRASCRES